MCRDKLPAGFDIFMPSAHLEPHYILWACRLSQCLLFSFTPLPCTLPSLLLYPASKVTNGDLLRPSLIGIGEQKTLDHKEHNFHPNSFMETGLVLQACSSSMLCWKDAHVLSHGRCSSYTWTDTFPGKTCHAFAGQERY